MSDEQFPDLPEALRGTMAGAADERTRRSGDPADLAYARQLADAELAGDEEAAAELVADVERYNRIAALLAGRLDWDDDTAVGGAMQAGLADGRVTKAELRTAGIESDALQAITGEPVSSGDIDAAAKARVAAYMMEVSAAEPMLDYCTLLNRAFDHFADDLDVVLRYAFYEAFGGQATDIAGFRLLSQK